MSNSLSVLISAPSGAGKTTLISKLMGSDSRFMFSVSTTTRTMREGEAEGVNYYYRTVEQFEEMIKNDEFLEWALVFDNYYGTVKKEVDRIHSAGKIPLFDVDVQGGRNLRGKLSAAFIFIMPPSMDSLKERLLKRSSDSEDQVNLRLKTAASEILEADHYDYIIVNDDVDNAVKDLKAVIRAEELKFSRMKIKISKILGD